MNPEERTGTKLGNLDYSASERFWVSASGFSRNILRIFDSGRVHTSELAPLPHGMLYNGP